MEYFLPQQGIYTGRTQEMDRQQNVFIFPGLQRLYQYPTPSYTLSRIVSVKGFPSMLPMTNQNADDNQAQVGQVTPEGTSSLQNAPSLPSSDKAGRSSKTQRSSGVLRGLFELASATAVAPIERINLLMQCQNEMIKSGRLAFPYKGMKDCFLRTIKEEGFASLWRGNSANVVCFVVIEGLITSLRSRSQKPRNENVDTSFKLLPYALACSIMQPFEYAKIRLANDVKVAAGGGHSFSLDYSTQKLKSIRHNGIRQFSGVFDVFKKTALSDGFGGVYRGFGVGVIGMLGFSYSTKWISTHVSFNKGKSNQKKSTVPIMTTIMEGFVYCVLPAAVFYPFYTLSRRMMMTSTEAIKYKHSPDALFHIVKHEGVSSLYKGITPFFMHMVAKKLVLLSLVSLVISGLSASSKK